MCMGALATCEIVDVQRSYITHLLSARLDNLALHPTSLPAFTNLAQVADRLQKSMAEKRRRRTDTTEGNPGCRSRLRRLSIEQRYNGGSNDEKDGDDDIHSDGGSQKALQGKRGEREHWVEKPIRKRLEPKVCVGCGVLGVFGSGGVCRKCGTENFVYSMRI